MRFKKKKKKKHQTVIHRDSVLTGVRMYHAATAHLVSVLAEHVQEVFSRVSIVQEHGQAGLLRQGELGEEARHLLLLAAKLGPVVVQAALTDGGDLWREEQNGCETAKN